MPRAKPESKVHWLFRGCNVGIATAKVVGPISSPMDDTEQTFFDVKAVHADHFEKDMSTAVTLDEIRLV